MIKNKRFISLNKEDGKDVRLLIDTKTGLLYSPKYHNDNIIGENIDTKDISDFITSWESMEDIKDDELDYLLPKELRDEFFYDINKKFLISSGEFYDVQVWKDNYDIDIFNGFLQSNIKKFTFNPNTKAIFNPDIYNNISELSKHKNIIDYTNKILEKINIYSKLNDENLSIINKIYLKLSNLNTNNENMQNIKEYLLEEFDFSLLSIQNSFINYKNQSIEFIKKLENENNIFNFIDDNSVNFNLYCETITNKYNTQIDKIEVFSQNREFLEKLLTQLEMIFSNLNNIYTSYKSNLLKKCQDEYVEGEFENIFNQFIDEFENINNRYFDILKNSFNNNLSQDTTLTILESMINYQKNIENYFISDRISLIQKYNKKEKSEFLQKVDIENSLFDFLIDFIEDMKSIINLIDNDIEKQIIDELIFSLIEREILIINLFSKQINMPENLQIQFLKLEKQNVEIYLDDIKSLLFKIEKDLEREN